MSDAEPRRQSRNTLLLFAFTVAVTAVMTWQSRATAEADAARCVGECVAGLMIETGGNSR